MTPELLAAVRAHAIECAPAECCGLFLWDGHDGAIYQPCRNVAAIGEFEIAPEDWAAAEDKGQILGVVHSHRVSAQPSTADISGRHASNLPWWIVTRNDWKRMPSPMPAAGRPFAWGVQDCYSLLQDYHHGLPDYVRGRDFEQHGDPYMENLEAEGWRVVDEDPQPGDLLFFSIRSADRINHAGVALGDGLILHHLPGRLAVKEPIGAWVRCLKHVVRAK